MAAMKLTVEASAAGGRHVGRPYNAKRWKFTIMDKDPFVESQECLLELYREQHKAMQGSIRSIELNLSF